MSASLVALKKAFLADDLQTVATLLVQQPDLQTQLDQDCLGICQPPLAAAKSKEMVDLLLDHGAKLESVSQWWAPGFGAPSVSTEIGEYLVSRGAALTAHAAAGLGLVERLRDLLDEKGELVHAKGGDACRPLHFARNVAVAKVLLSRGADVHAKDEDHDSTAAQWRIGPRRFGPPDVTRYLLENGATPDIFMAAALDDLGLAQTLVYENPQCVTYRIGNNQGPFPGIGHQGRGGTIYQWTLGFNLSPHEVAHQRGHFQVYQFLMDHSPPRHKLLAACTMADRKLAHSIVAEHPAVMDELDKDDHALLAKSCWETNLNIDAVRLMLDLGFPVDAPEFNHGYSPLHNAAWCGDAQLVELLIERGHPVDVRDPDHQSTAVGWAIYSCLEAKRHPDGQFARVIDLLLENGAPLDDKTFPTGHAEIDAVLKKHRGR